MRIRASTVVGSRQLQVSLLILLTVLNVLWHCVLLTGITIRIWNKCNTTYSKIHNVDSFQIWYWPQIHAKATEQLVIKLEHWRIVCILKSLEDPIGQWFYHIFWYCYIILSSWTFSIQFLNFFVTMLRFLLFTNISKVLIFLPSWLLSNVVFIETEKYLFKPLIPIIKLYWMSKFYPFAKLRLI